MKFTCSCNNFYDEEGRKVNFPADNFRCTTKDEYTLEELEDTNNPLPGTKLICISTEERGGDPGSSFLKCKFYREDTLAEVYMHYKAIDLLVINL